PATHAAGRPGHRDQSVGHADHPATRRRMAVGRPYGRRVPPGGGDGRAAGTGGRWVRPGGADPAPEGRRGRRAVGWRPVRRRPVVAVVAALAPVLVAACAGGGPPAARWSPASPPAATASPTLAGPPEVTLAFAGDVH